MKFKYITLESTGKLVAARRTELDAQYNPEHPLVRECVICASRENLTLCKICQVAPYCSEIHMEMHRKRHYRICNTIKHHRDLLAKAAPFQRSLFAQERKRYELAHYRYFLSLPNMNTLDTLLESRTHGEELLQDLVLYSDHGDAQGVRYHLPALYLRLGQDQECYNYIKSSCHLATERNEDLFESIGSVYSVFETSVADQCRYVPPLLLILFKLYRQLLDVRRTALLTQKAPLEILKEIRCHIVIAPTFYTNKQQLSNLIHGANPQPLIAKLQRYMKGLYLILKVEHKNFWPSLSNLEPVERRYFGNYASERAMNIYKANARSWHETPGAIELIEILGEVPVNLRRAARIEEIITAYQRKLEEQGCQGRVSSSLQ